MKRMLKATDHYGQAEDCVEGIYGSAQQYFSTFKQSLLSSQRKESTSEITVSGTHLLLAMGIIIASAGPLVWLFVKYWLFAV
jgi:hypothetical protein